jgi:ABC-type nitrate/sulfonate/bicarbonate transport system permease component
MAPEPGLAASVDVAAVNQRSPHDIFVRVLPALLILGGALIWEWSVHAGHVSALFFPAPSTIAATLRRLFVQGGLLQDVAITLYRLAVGLLIGGTTGIVMGMLMGWSTRLRTVAEPFVAGLHPLPKSALLPLLLMLMGLGDRPRLALIALAAFFPLLINTMNSVRSIDPAYLDVAANYGAHGFSLFRRVIVPASLPGILTGARIALNTALTITITVELLTSHDGLGARVWMAWQTMRTENLYAVLIIIVVIGIVTSQLLVLLARWLMPWNTDLLITEK